MVTLSTVSFVSWRYPNFASLDGFQLSMCRDICYATVSMRCPYLKGEIWEYLTVVSKRNRHPIGSILGAACFRTLEKNGIVWRSLERYFSHVRITSLEHIVTVTNKRTIIKNYVCRDSFTPFRNMTALVHRFPLQTVRLTILKLSLVFRH